MLPVSVAPRRRAAGLLIATRPRWWRRRATALDVLCWNAAAALAAATLVMIACAPTRLWAAGCALQCMLHAACVTVEQWVGSEEDDDAGSAIGWLCIVLLAFEFFAVVFCVVLACIWCAAVCCCLLCIMAIMCELLDQQVASDEDILLLPRYNNFRCICNQGDLCIGTCTFTGVITESETNQFIGNAWSSDCEQ